MCDLYSDSDPYFHEVNNFFNQMKGILDGYNKRVLIENDPNINQISLAHFI